MDKSISSHVKFTCQNIHLGTVMMMIMMMMVHGNDTLTGASVSPSTYQ